MSRHVIDQSGLDALGKARLQQQFTRIARRKLPSASVKAMQQQPRSHAVPDARLRQFLRIARGQLT